MMKFPFNYVVRLVVLGMAIVGVVGCSSQDQPDLKEWMARERASVRPKIDPIPEPTKFIPKAYETVGFLAPFDKERLTSVLQGASQEAMLNSALIEPELQRRKEPLEAFPLDNMKLVGSLIKNGEPVALIKVNQLLYQVRRGQYLGQNFGRIMGINETEVLLREIVQDATGEWMERPATLLLQEDSK